MAQWIQTRALRIGVLAFLIVATAANLALGADGGSFVGRIAVEWLDAATSGEPMRLLEDFEFRDGAGKSWLATKDHVLTGHSFPTVFRSLAGPPFAGSVRKAAVIYDYYSEVKTVPWRETNRAFYAASRAAGVDATQAKVMYMTLHAEGPRWETKEGSHCYRSCHAAASMLAWRPVIGDEADLHPIVEWIERDDPELGDIDRRVDGITKRPGPHLFAQGH